MKQLALIGLLFLSTYAGAQTFGNMPFTTPQLSNPAFIVLNDKPQLNVFGKIGRIFSSSYVGYNQYAPKLKGSWGVYHNSLVSNYNSNYQYRSNNVGLTYARLFSINDKWKYSIGAGLQFSNFYRNYEDDISSKYNGAINIGGVLYDDRFFTSLNFGVNLQGFGQLTLRTGYKLQPFKNLDLSFTPMLTINSSIGRIFPEANLNIAYNKLSMNLGYNYDGYNLGLGYDFNRFKLNYSVGNMFSLDSKQYFHEIGLQFKFGKNKAARNTKFNHDLF